MLTSDESDSSNEHSSVANSLCRPSDLYVTLHEYLGDSLSMRLPIVHCSFRSATHPPATRFTEPNVLGEDSSAGQTGEQLLQQFLDPTTRDGVIHVRSERSSEHSSPASSDYGGVAEDDADMAIKETVSDPTRGIRLTILKRPKARPADDGLAAKRSKVEDGTGQVSAVPIIAAPDSNAAASQEVAGPNVGKDGEPFGAAEMPALKMSKASTQQPGSKVKPSLSDVFEDLVIRSRAAARRDSSASSVVFVFKFQGRVQECVAPTGPRLLPRWGIGGRTTLSWYQVLCRRSTFVGKRSRSKASAKPAAESRGAYGDCQAAKKDQSCWRKTCALDLAWTLL
jgi:hypothetical protein